MVLNHLNQSLKDNEQPFGKILFLIRADGTAGDITEPVSGLVYYSVPGGPGTGVNPDNPG